VVGTIDLSSPKWIFTNGRVLACLRNVLTAGIKRGWIEEILVNCGQGDALIAVGIMKPLIAPKLRRNTSYSVSLVMAERLARINQQ